MQDCHFPFWTMMVMALLARRTLFRRSWGGPGSTRWRQVHPTLRKYIVSCGKESTINICSLGNLKRNLELVGHTKNLTAMLFSFNKNVLATASIWTPLSNSGTGTTAKTKTIKGHCSRHRCGLFSGLEGRVCQRRQDREDVEHRYAEIQSFLPAQQLGLL